MVNTEMLHLVPKVVGNLTGYCSVRFRKDAVVCGVKLEGKVM